MYYRSICLLKLVLLTFNSFLTQGTRVVYLGCYEDSAVNGSFEWELVTDLNNVTTWSCVNSCLNMSKSYAAIGRGSKCSCGSLFTPSSRSSEIECDFPCEGNFNERCGGFWKISLYGIDLTNETHNVWETVITKGVQESTASPHRRAGHTSVSFGESLILFAGYTFWYVQEISTSDNMTLNITNPIHSLYNITKDLVLFNDVWKLDLGSSTWSLLHDGSHQLAPPKRTAHSTVLAQGRYMLIFGGFSYDGPLNDLWQFDINLSTWSLISTGMSPGERGYHQAVFVNNFMYIFGGATSSLFYNDFWKFDFIWREWSQIRSGNLPDARAEHAMVVYQNSIIVVFGRGKSQEHCIESKIFKDIWLYDFTYKEWTILSDGSSPWDLVNKRWALDSPAKRFGHAAVSINEGIILFGGTTSTATLNDIWRFDIGARLWEPLSQGITPFNRSRHTMVSLQNGILLFGGEFSLYSYFNDIWLWKYNSSLFITPESFRGSTGWNIGITFGVFWGTIFLILACIYFPKKKRSLRDYIDTRNTIEDVEIFGTDKFRKRKTRKKHTMIPMVTFDESPFDKLPDELVMRVFSHLPAMEMSRVSIVSKRFYNISNDHIYWKLLCQQYWKQIDLEQPPDKSFYISRFSAYRQRTQEAKFFTIFALFRTTLPYYIILFILSTWIYMIGLKLDGYIDVPWVYVFTPIWLICLGMILLILFAISIRFNGSPAMNVSIKKIFPQLFSLPSMIILSTFFAGFISFFLLLALRLDAATTEIVSFSWWVIFAPLFYMGLLLIAAPIIALLKGSGWKCSFWGVFLGLSYNLTAYLSVAKLENYLTDDWCLIFLPWWISDVFALVSAVSLCMEMRSTKLGWLITSIYTSYMACIITFRSLLCVNLGTACADPVGYSYNLVFLSIQVFLITFGVPIAVFMRNK